MSDIGRVWISIVAAVGTFFVSGLSIYLGYKLFATGATGGFHFTASVSGWVLDLASTVPGIAFAAFGMVIATNALNRLIHKD